MTFWTHCRNANECTLEIISLLSLSPALMEVCCPLQMDKWFSLSLFSPIMYFSSRSFPYLVHQVASKKYQNVWENDVGCKNTATQVAGKRNSYPSAQVQLPNSWKWAQNFLTVRLVTTVLKPLPFPCSPFLAITTNQLKSNSSLSFSAARTFSSFPKAGNLISV